MVKIKNGFKECNNNCYKPIDLKKDKYVLVGTYNINNSLKSDETYWHFSCWSEYFNNCVLKKAKANVQLLQSKALKILDNPMIKGAMAKISGGDQIVEMLNTDLDSKEKDVNFIKKVEKKIEDDRTKKTGKKRKVKMQ